MNSKLILDNSLASFKFAHSSQVLSMRNLFQIKIFLIDITAKRIYYLCTK